jgi:hypothetical protein
VFFFFRAREKNVGGGVGSADGEKSLIFGENRW